MVTVEDVTIGWGATVLLERLDFTIEHGEVFVILGGSGCGKSTLMRHIAGLERPQRGRITVDGIGDPAEYRGPPAFGVMFQSGALFGSMTVGENVALPLRQWTALDEAAIGVIVRGKLALVGLDGYEHHLPAEISGGMKKRAAIARSLALESRLLLLDEPSAGLDPITAAELDELILTLNRSLGTTIVIVTHELQSIFSVASRCVMLDKGARGMLALGDPNELREDSDDPRVLDFFHRRPRAETAS